MGNTEPMPKWRNFWAWSAVGAIVCTLAMWGGISILHQEGVGAVLQSGQAAGILSLCLIFAIAVVGFGNRSRPFSLRTLRNFVIRDAVGIVACLLFVWGFSTLAASGALVGMGTSEWAAAATGSALIIIALLGILATASVRAGADFVDDEMAADDMRERGRLILCSLVWIAACGLLLIGLSLSGPGGLLSPATALSGALVLIAVLTVLGIAAWRLSDELGRTLSHETGNMAFYLVWVLGGGWAMLSHLGFVARPTPLDWLTMFIVLMFVAGVIATGRRKLLTR